MDRRIRRSVPPALAIATAASILVAACSPSSQASPPSGSTAGVSATSAAATTSVSAPPSLAATASPGAGARPFVAANVQVTATLYAKVNGSALALAAPSDGSGRLFVATQEGQIWSTTGTGAAPVKLLDIAKEITTGGERGLLGLALHPKFPTDPRAFVNYTDRDGNTVIASFSLQEGGTFDPASETVILRQQQPYPNHNGGGVEFGPDGDLYVGLGDGGSGGDPQGNGQSLATFLAKMLRVDVDHRAPGAGYSIPTTNPLVGHTGTKAEIWLSGLRNPFRFSFDRETGDLWIGDVGQEKWEEIDVIRAGDPGGEDLGWNVMEGNHCYQPADGCTMTGLTRPISEYGHDQGCAVIGGNVYRGTAYPALVGGYLFSDSCSGTLWAIPAATTTFVEPVPVGQIGGSPAGFGEDQAGELYVARLDGTIWKLAATTR